MNRFGKSVRNFFDNINILAVIFPWLMIIPNILLDITEQMSFTAKAINIIVPLSLYYLLMSARKNAGVTMLWLIIFMIMNGFQIVVLYLFGESIIAIDMLINCVTTNGSEAGELLKNLVLPMLISAVIYLPVIGWGYIGYHIERINMACRVEIARSNHCYRRQHNTGSKTYKPVSA